ncbi:hypothetical protein Bca4012_018667 [Brassica carinata]
MVGLSSLNDVPRAIAAYGATRDEDSQLRADLMAVNNAYRTSRWTTKTTGLRLGPRQGCSISLQKKIWRLRRCGRVYV